VSLDVLDRTRLAQLADVLIPGGDGMPAASAAGATGAALDRVLAIRDDLRPALDRVVGTAGPPAEVLRALHDGGDPAFEAFVLLLTCAYGLSEEVRVGLGYPGQVAYALPAGDEPGLAELLAPVAARGARLVPAPGG
jgi:hypothetical protein